MCELIIQKMSDPTIYVRSLLPVHIKLAIADLIFTLSLYLLLYIATLALPRFHKLSSSSSEEIIICLGQKTEVFKKHHGQ